MIDPAEQKLKENTLRRHSRPASVGLHLLAKEPRRSPESPVPRSPKSRIRGTTGGDAEECARCTFDGLPIS